MGKKTDTIKKAARTTTVTAPTAVVEAPAATPVKRTVRRTPAAASAPKAAAAVRQISGEDIALRAYFIAEKRQQQGQPGDSQSDWIEAERQLRAEASGTKPKAGQAASANGDSAV